jgi:hypothetical protein
VRRHQVLGAVFRNKINSGDGGNEQQEEEDMIAQFNCHVIASRLAFSGITSTFALLHSGFISTSYLQNSLLGTGQPATTTLSHSAPRIWHS